MPRAFAQGLGLEKACAGYSRDLHGFSMGRVERASDALPGTQGCLGRKGGGASPKEWA